jgi:hypothetical protein
MLRFLPLPLQFVVLREQSRNLAPSLEREVDALWQKELLQRGSKLFNGPLFSIEQISDETVSGRFVEYRLFLAQMRRPELFAELRVQPLAVTGLLQNADGLFFGYRGSDVAQQPECWELIPAGGIDRGTLTESGQILPVQQLLAELNEEVGLNLTDISPPRLVCFCKDENTHIFDLVWELQTMLNAASVMSAHARIAQAEHANITCVPWKDLDQFLAGRSHPVLASNRDLLADLTSRKLLEPHR